MTDRRPPPPSAIPAGVRAWLDATVAAATGDPAMGHPAHEAARALRELAERAGRALGAHRSLVRAKCAAGQAKGATP